MHVLRFTTLLAFLLIALPALAETALEVPSSADARSAETETGTHARARLLVHADPASQQGFVGVLFDLDPGWHLYWRNPGDSGLPTELHWTFGAATVAVGEIAWPAPHAFAEDTDIVTYGYEDQVLLAAPFSHVEGPPLRKISVAIDALVCADQCIPASFALESPYPIGRSTASEAATTALFERYATRVPTPASARGVEVALSWPASLAEGERGSGSLAIQACGPGCDPKALAHAQFFPIAPDTLRVVGAPLQLEGSGGPHVPLSIERFEADPPSTLTGVLRLATQSGDERFVELDLSLDAARAAPAAQAGPGLLHALLLGFLGGLLLNLMPCVLPVLSIKLLSVVSHGGRDRGAVRAGFLASAAGILASFLVLAGIALMLKAAGMAAGWGIQFQQPLFLSTMALVVMLFALNLLGLFEIPLPGWLGGLAGVGREEGSGGLAGNFLTGAFATLLATPCTAPFLGTAVGFALARGPLEIVSIFVFLGLGLALPYLVIAAAPGLATRLPRPGHWMVTLRRILGLALAGTAAWLLTVLAAQVGTLAALLVGSLLLGLSLLLTLRGRLSRGLVGAAAAALCLAAVLVPAGFPATAEAPAERATAEAWLPFDQAEIARLVADGKVVFVDVTADWCITCQVNKSLVIERGEVARRLGGDEVVTMRADWTLPSDEIADYLAGFGRYGIPFNVVYGPGAPEGRTLPELLTGDAVLAALNGALGG